MATKNGETATNGTSSATQSIRDLFKDCKGPDLAVSSGHLPKLQIPSIFIGDDNHHRLEFPLTNNPEAIERIKGQGSLATVGLNGVETVQPEARLSHQLLPQQLGGSFKVENLQEQQAFQDLLTRIQSDLGLSGKVEVDLYKFLYYETGGFFQKHRDHERLENQVGTLILQLPSIFEGGNLRVWAPDALPEDEPIATAALPSSSNSMSYAAFYTDCCHEVTKLTDGHRCVLVFSLISLYTSETPTLPLLSVLSSGAVLATYLKQFKQESFRSQEPDKLVIPLSHSYARNSLAIHDAFLALKGSDVDIVKIVTAAVKDAEFEAFIYLVNETGPDDRNHVKGDVRTLADTECPPIVLPGSGTEKSFYLTDTHRIPIFKKDIVVGSGEVLLCKNSREDEDKAAASSSNAATNARSGSTSTIRKTEARRYKRAVIVLWPLSFRQKVIDSILQYGCQQVEYHSESDEDEDGGWDAIGHSESDEYEDGAWVDPGWDAFAGDY